MAGAAGATPPLLPGLPDEIAIWEILVRLPPKSVLRSRAVSPAWRRVTSTRGFLLSHHARQPALPLQYTHSIVADGGESLDVVPFDHRAGVAAADRFQCVARLQRAPHFYHAPRFYLEASCDGLLVLSFGFDDICICNLATRQYAPLQQVHGFSPVELYPHPSTGEYRLLLYQGEDQDAIYVFTVGSGQPPRHIRCLDPLELQDCPGLLFHGSLYWYIGNRIMVFDTTAESFRQIRAPVASDHARLFEMGDMLGVSSLNDEETAIDIWVMRDYQGEVWDFKRRIDLPAAEIRHQCQCSLSEEDVMVVPGDGELVVLVGCNGWLFQVDVNGKLIASFQPRGLNSTLYVLKQTLVQHTFFPALEGYVVNASPFI
ncbi:uncharacterized protein LOC119318482 [Triticum dicoccoides]|uniref:uncharacterized protein LOC119318482 n=1 Tax=Triticum dicoccoides TaxID=85692 RepID=UPI00189047A0|nr:uncharacterized protein LOC119318482 [Triticum dicoccoides]XP_037448954.1 uncharacterized protein LOC119318482 [Triticum dicoccoides]XP_037448961.1 uncharacterized protein LOC119318482 [Triticum dicoccoides]XP_037448968.1 uncharacterized protein LOC119318482 [Triticum dicoccoides]